MTEQERGEVSQAYIKLSAYYQKPLPDYVIDMYVADLDDLPAEALLRSLFNWRRDPRNDRCPLPSKIRAMIQPSEDDDSLSREAVSRILTAVTKFGYTNGKAAEVFIGELGWTVVQKYGGWSHLCHQMGVSIKADNFLPQARDMAKTVLARARAGTLDKPPGLPKAVSSRAVQMLLERANPKGIDSH